MKKTISVFICVLILLSCVAVTGFSAVDTECTVKHAIDMYEQETGETVATNRYYFLMPNGSIGNTGEYLSYDEDGEPIVMEDAYEISWYNKYTTTAGIYWWDSGVADPQGWPGYAMEKADSDSIFYADVPQEVTTIVFNNAVNGGMDPDVPIYHHAFQTVNVPCEFYEPGENDSYPDGVDSFDNMIFVVTPGIKTTGELTLQHARSGEWYYYYGGGCYGTVADGDDSNCIRCDHDHHMLGDVDSDLEITVLDATEIQSHVAKLIFIDEDRFVCADIDKDGEISVLDATAIQRFIAKLIPQL